jgi:hypothetical protein
MKKGVTITATEGGGGKGVMKKYYDKLANLQQEISSKDSSRLTNHEKRVIHARLELLRLDLIEAHLVDKKKSSSSVPVTDEIETFHTELDQLDEQLNLSFVSSSSSLLYQLHDLIRLLVVLYFLFTAGMIISLPLLLLRVTDPLLATLSLPRPYKPICVSTKSFIATYILLTSGVVLKTQGLTPQTFSPSRRTLACFTHGSTIDAFVLAATLPIPATVLAKKELFLL